MCLWFIFNLALIVIGIGMYIGCLGICLKSFTGRIAYDVSIHNNTIINDPTYNTLIMIDMYEFDRIRIGCSKQSYVDITTYSSYYIYTCVSPVNNDSMVQLWITRSSMSYTDDIPSGTYTQPFIRAITRLDKDVVLGKAIHDACKERCEYESLRSPIFIENISAFNVQSYNIISAIGWTIFSISIILSISTLIALMIISCKYQSYENMSTNS